MYDWLSDALDDDSSIVVTANLRLTRTLREAYGEQQIAAGVSAWQSPQIHVWAHWISALYDAAETQDALPTRLNSRQTRVLWERSLRREVDESVVAIASLAKLARDNWARMNDWLLDPDECANAAVGQDQRIFARAVHNYRSELIDKAWIDESMLSQVIGNLVAEGQVLLPSKITLAGFDRVTPAIQRLLNLLEEKEVKVIVREPGERKKNTLLRYETPEAELRAAGSWAARELQRDPVQELAVVVVGLDSHADKAARLLREGMTPGWQYGKRRRAAAVNVSYGQPLNQYPAIHAALLMLRWQIHGLHGSEISLLLRSPFFGIGPVVGRTRLEMLLRDWPDRQWTPDRLLYALRGREESDDAVDWLTRIAQVNGMSEALTGQANTSAWARTMDELLAAWNWPGEQPLGSVDFQLVNRWRDLLNEFAQLELVVLNMSKVEAISRLSAMAGDTLFQPEAEGAVLSVLGPLEAAGLEFDQVWVVGLAADDWPPPGRPSALIAREIQIDRALPDADPQDTAAYAKRVLDRLRTAGTHCLLSYAANATDRAQLPSALLDDLVHEEGIADPGWHADSLRSHVTSEELADNTPQLLDGESISGGANTINLQKSEPFAAFVSGRLDTRLLWPFAAGIAANVRGSLIHDALFNLYADRPAQEDIAAWSEDSLTRRIDAAIDGAFARQERYSDDVLRELLKLEKHRTAKLLGSVVAMDRSRDAFKVATVERGVEGQIGPLTISLRCDRIDELLNGDIVILDYKTGARKRFLRNGEPDDMQLVVYACVAERDVSGLGLYNVDTGFLGIDGAGPALGKPSDWDEALASWKKDVYVAADGIAAGDVRLNIRQASSDARPLALLSRIEEMRRDN